VDGDAEVVSRSGEQVSDVALRAEPQGAPVGETGGQGLGDEPPGAAVAGAAIWAASSSKGRGSAIWSTSGWG